MYVVILAREMQLAALVKERLDCRKVGLTHTVRIVDPEAVEQAVQTLRPSVIVLVSHHLDSLALDVCERLGKNPATNHVPLIAATELATEAERIAVLEAGADSVVLPFNIDAIEWRVRASRARTNVRQAYRGKELSFEGDGSTVSVSGVAVTLTPLEASVLRLLVHKRNAPVSRGELELILWGRTRSRTIDVHISRLRKKLGHAGSRIQSVIKVGYRFIESA